MREHLRNVHEKSAAHHVRMAKGHRMIAKHFGKSEMEEGSEDLADAHQELAKAHADQAEFHLECCKALDGMGKALGMDNDPGDAIRPDGISVIAGEVPAHLRMIPRAGQREIIGKGEVSEVVKTIFGEDI
jgi:hypothetical protein